MSGNPTLRRPIVVGVAVATLVGACSARPPETIGSAEPFASAYSEALNSGASSEQLAALEDAATTGKMDFATLQQLTANTFRCFEDAGIDYRVEEPLAIAPGILMPWYGASEESEGAFAVIIACENDNSYFASMAYQNQKSVAVALDEAFARELPAIRACLLEHGVIVDTDATPDEVKSAATELLDSSNQAGAPVMCGKSIFGLFDD